MIKYDLKIRNLIEEQKRYISSQGYNPNTTVLDNCNECPGCGKIHKEYRGEIVKVGSISGFPIPGTDDVILYCLCSECAINASNRSIYNNSDAVIKIENFIYERFPQFKSNDALNKEKAMSFLDKFK